MGLLLLEVAQVFGDKSSEVGLSAARLPLRVDGRYLARHPVS
jgi:hypothetical protein